MEYEIRQSFASADPPRWMTFSHNCYEADNIEEAIEKHLELRNYERDGYEVDIIGPNMYTIRLGSHKEPSLIYKALPKDSWQP